jgi:hypothetical protein
MRGGDRGAEQAFENGAGRSGHGWNSDAVSAAEQQRTWIFDLRFDLSLSFGTRALAAPAGLSPPAATQLREPRWKVGAVITILSLRRGAAVGPGFGPFEGFRRSRSPRMPLDEHTRTELEAAAFRRLIEHLRARTDVQNIDLMNLAGFCRNCLSNWMKDAADARGVPMSKDESREAVYGMPYEEWRAKHQKEASKEQQAAFEKAAPHKH